MDIIKDISYEIKHIDRGPKPVRRFGLILSFLLLLLAAYLAFRENPQWIWPAGAAVLSLLASLVVLSVIRPLYIGLTALTIPIGYFVSKLILITLYVLFFVPVGILSRLFRRDLLSRRIDRKAPTYWIKKPKDETPVREKYERLY